MKYFFVLLLLVGNSYCYSQTNVYSYISSKQDSILLIQKRISDAQANLDKQNFTIQIKTEKEESAFDKYFYRYFRDLSPSLVALLGIFLTLPILRRKFIENHISTALNKIQVTNSEVKISNQKLIDNYLPHTYQNNVLRIEEIKFINEQIKNAFYLANEASSEVITVLYLIKSIIEKILKNYEENKKPVLFTQDFFGFIISLLNLTNYFTTQVVKVPRNTKIVSENIINLKIRKLVTKSNFSKFKYFDQGINLDINSALVIIFYDRINKINNNLIKRSAFQVFMNNSPLIKNLYLQEIYAAPIIEKKYEVKILGVERLELFLIGFSFLDQYTMEDGSSKEIVNLVYSNLDDQFLFVENLLLAEFKNEFKDSYLDESKFDLVNGYKELKNGFESITLQFDKRELRDIFKLNRKRIRHKLNSQTKDKI